VARYDDEVVGLFLPFNGFAACGSRPYLNFQLENEEHFQKKLCVMIPTDPCRRAFGLIQAPFTPCVNVISTDSPVQVARDVPNGTNEQAISFEPA
jgi:hypothetical protein